MQYLTPSELAKAAPATRRLREKADTLLDTAAFLRHIERHKGFLPVLAAQGTGHEDALYGPSKGRHLVVAADRRGNALILLNSHSVRRKAWMGAGFVAIQADRPLFVVGAAIPIARWRGFVEPLRELEKWIPALQETKKAIEDWPPSTDEIGVYARAFAERAYLSDHKKAAATAFSDITARDGFELMFRMLGRAMDGNLEPAIAEGRRLKPIKGPDALMHAGNAAFSLAATHVGSTMPFPRYQKT